jgi:tetratricopeptide (TPR) repeat protein
MTDTAELPQGVYDQIRALGTEGDGLAEAGRFDEAIARYEAAWEALPEPKQVWNAATWILGAIGDVAFQAGRTTLAIDALGSAIQCPGGAGNPFLQMRLGQALLDSGDEESAAHALGRALELAGPEIFTREDGRYLSFAAARLKA